LAKWGINANEDEYIKLNKPEEGKAPKWGQELFDPEILNTLDDDFFSELKCGEFKLTETGLIKLGEKYLPNENNDEVLYKEGVKRLALIPEDINSIKKNFKEKVLIGISNNSKDEASGLQGHENFYKKDSGTLEEIQRQLYQVSDFIFSGNPKDRDYFLGKKTSLEEISIRCGGVKPCFHGSDAHSEDKLFNPDNNRNCWIKCDPTFEGLKQAIHEPESRVIIQEFVPEPKNDYEIIDKISFNDKNGKEVVVNLNQNLNTIIGGKSTGKSLLLKNIVNNIDKEQLDDKLKLQKEFLELNEFSVKWRDDIDSEATRKREYIPQSFLNRLMDDVDSKTIIDEIAKNVLLQNKKRKENLKKLEIKCKEKEIEIESVVDNYFNLEAEIIEVNRELKGIGPKEGIEKNNGKLFDKIKQLKTDSGMSEEKIREMEGLKVKLTELLKKMKN